MKGAANFQKKKLSRLVRNVGITNFFLKYA